MDSHAQMAERNVAFYIRVSTDRQAQVEEGSLKNQQQMLEAELQRRNIHRHGWGVFVDSYVDEGLSGKNTNRPALQRMMDDIAVGRVDTVMFTELSRLSRSLRDFLSIFEFARAHNCDLICLKTEIDTTSAYSGLVTKILMIFAEFEREMTVQRTIANAYERAKRGLANGGAAPLGYRRDPERKGYLLIDETESRVVREIFTTYLRERSLSRTTAIIRDRYQGTGPKLKRITKNKIHVVLTNKAYIGVKVINRRGVDSYEEVPAVWEPIIEPELFEQAQQALRENRPGRRTRSTSRYRYLFSGLIRCGLCGQKLSGSSSRSSNGTIYHYYTHHGVCPKEGAARTDTETVHRLVLEWLGDIANGGDRFEWLKTEATDRLQRAIVELQSALGELDTESIEIDARIEVRITELTRIDVDSVRTTIESSIAKLAEEKRWLETRRLYLEHEIKQIDEILDKSRVFAEYRETVRDALINGSGRASDSPTLKNLFARLSLFPEHIETALSRDAVTGPVASSSAFVRSPPDRLELPT